ncbi:Protein of unknown function [Pseudomonas sp. NFACC02]|uniref:DUF3304 domain-containing protein n=1 Tax=Pseudomonas sp. NFACC02 TaxID=1566250 RepID=UPI0008B4DB8A|nr:DUF3304 domain-containing protein [Pseudomonas sp. NFACC02]SEQ24437.1 Protein of unknown function [Pseudomonas sp. NFACC02]
MRMNLGMFLALAALFVAASKYEKPPPEPPPKPRYVGTAVTPMDHEISDTFVRPVYVNGGGVGAASTGGSTTYGALGLPAIWHPGLTVRVKWRRCEAFYKENPKPDSEACHWTEKDVLVHPYDQSGETNLHFLENDDVLIIPSILAPNNPDYPGPGFPEKNFYARKGISK